METQLNETFEFLKQHDRFFMASHEKTDGDDLGSMLALSMILKKTGKQVVCVAKGGVPQSLQFLPEQISVLSDYLEPIDSNNFDAVILFGCNIKNRTGLDSLLNSTLPILNIDHHQDNKNFGTVNLIDAQKSSVAELVYDLIKFTGVELDVNIARCVLTGIFTDTGSFMHANTQASTLKAAGELMKYGARIDKIHNFTYSNKDLLSLKAWGKALENARVDSKSGVGISIMTAADLQEFGELPQDAFDGFVETLNKIPGTRFAVFMRQDGNVIKGSIRSEKRKNVDVSFIAKLLGGGGHKLASGFTISGKIIKNADGSWRIEK